jgi:hypothetical protein
MSKTAEKPQLLLKHHLKQRKRGCVALRDLA